MAAAKARKEAALFVSTAPEQPGRCCSCRREGTSPDRRPHLRCGGGATVWGQPQRRRRTELDLGRWRPVKPTTCISPGRASSASKTPWRGRFSSLPDAVGIRRERGLRLHLDGTSQRRRRAQCPRAGDRPPSIRYRSFSGLPPRWARCSRIEEFIGRRRWRKMLGGCARRESSAAGIVALEEMIGGSRKTARRALAAGLGAFPASPSRGRRGPTRFLPGQSLLGRWGLSWPPASRRRSSRAVGPSPLRIDARTSRGAGGRPGGGSSQPGSRNEAIAS